jgi:hypothetical protein
MLWATQLAKMEQVRTAQGTENYLLPSPHYSVAKGEGQCFQAIRPLTFRGPSPRRGSSGFRSQHIPTYIGWHALSPRRAGSNSSRFGHAHRRLWACHPKQFQPLSRKAWGERERVFFGLVPLVLDPVSRAHLYLNLAPFPELHGFSYTLVPRILASSSFLCTKAH